MAEPVTDLLMMISVDGSTGVPAGSTASVDTRGKLNSGFTAGCYFELEEFGFGMRLEPKEGSARTQPTSVQAAKAGANAASGVAPPKPAEKDFSIWRSIKPGEDEPEGRYKCKPEAFTIKRLVDAATPVLFQHCANRLEFAKASIIKRYRGQGDGATAGTLKTLTFLRMDFGKVLLTSMDWSEGDVVMETSRFTFQTFNVTFVQQNNDGSAGTSTNGAWAKL